MSPWSVWPVMEPVGREMVWVVGVFWIRSKDFEERRDSDMQLMSLVSVGIGFNSEILSLRIIMVSCLLLGSPELL